MTRAALRTAALDLPPNERAALAAELLDSLDASAHEDTSAAWETEIDRRVHELDSGEVTTIPASEVMRRLRRP
jgi:putative addiction module component (TIGR02574 family)